MKRTVNFIKYLYIITNLTKFNVSIVLVQYLNVLK
jgi:hypothetical protein